MFNFFNRTPLNSIHVNDLDDLLGTIKLIDIREPYEFRSGSIKTAKNIPMNTLLSNPDKYLKKEEKAYIVCQSGGRSMSAVRMLTQAGYDVVNVTGGVGSYAGTRRQ